MKKYKLVLFVLLICLSGYSQVGIGTETPDESCVLDLTSTTQGFLPPRMGYQDMVGILTPAEGLHVYCTDCDPKGLYFYDGSSFLSVISGSVLLDPTTFVYSSTGKYWMDRNLGAQQVATAYNDHLSYGDFYQWGRDSDGHQTIVWTSSTTSDGTEQSNEIETLATTTVPDDGNAWNGKFITNAPTPFNWLVTLDVTLWQGVSGTNNPCPSGYRIPTAAEFLAESNNGGTDYWGNGEQNDEGAYNSVLKLPYPGMRDLEYGEILEAGNIGVYWTSTYNSSGSFVGADTMQVFPLDDSGVFHMELSYGLSVRCIKD
ncbi:hypothetical protein [Thalassobellus citreus]|uniref:hypothetical protein n=1 Tax=Thalassobellus citreus TaxID=3367752 RepID=UPI00378F16A0